jgi:DDB1- and CUL4-associated factor 11
VNVCPPTLSFTTQSSPKVFFIDTSGALCARASGHALDVESQAIIHSFPLRVTTLFTDGRLVLRHRRPLTQPYPNAYSHPLPRFRHNGSTGFLTVKFDCDPAYASGTAWRAQTFYLTALARRRPRTLLDDASDALVSAFRVPLSLLGGGGVHGMPVQDPTAAGTDDTFNLREDEVEEQERGEDAEVDDDPARDRAVRVIGLTPEEHHELSDKAWARRRWEVIPLRSTAARHFGGLS